MPLRSDGGIEAALIDLAYTKGFPLVATNEPYFASTDDYEAHDALLCIAEGTYVTFGGVSPSKLTGAGQQWYQKYKQQYNSEPEAYAGYGYESMKVALDAINRANTKDRAAVRDAIFATRNFSGALGQWSFTDTGDTTLTTMSGRQVKNGAFDDANAVTLEAPQ